MRLFLLLAFTFLVRIAWSQTCDSVTVSGPPAGAPASWDADGQLIGAGVELAQKLLKSAGVKQVKVVRFASWPDTLAAVRTGKVDMIFSAGWSADRARYLNYVYPAHGSQFLHVLVRKGNQFNLNRYEDLKGRKGLAGLGESFGDSTFGSLVETELTIERSPSTDETFRRLLAGEVDYVFAYENAAYSEIYRRDLGDKIESLVTYPYRSDTFFAFSKRSKCGAIWKDKIGVEIEKANRSNDYFLLLKKYRTIFNESQSNHSAQLSQ
jgi:polar amino acid transport system substrate-binding protein